MSVLRRLAAVAGLCLVAVGGCDVKDYSTSPFAPCPHGYTRVQVSYHAPDSWACYRRIG